MNMNAGCFSTYSHIKYKLSKMKAAVRATGKDRNTAFVCANMDGSEKMPLLATGKSEKPRYFKHQKSLPCTYRHNSSTWITCVLLTESPECLEGGIAAQNWKIL
jgi:hypothetical protein